MFRSVLSVVAGSGLWAVLWCISNVLLVTMAPGIIKEDGSTDSAGALALFLCLSVVFSVAAGYLTGSIARRRAICHVAVLAFVQLAIGTAVQLQYWEQIPLWYHVSFLALLVPGVLGGGKFALAR